MKSLQRILLLALPLGIAAALSAQTDTTTHARGPHAGRGGPGPHGRGNPIIRTLDADQDGTLNAAEINAAPTALRALDTDADGALSAVELRPKPPAGAPQPPQGLTRPEPPEGVTRPDRADLPRPHDPVMLALDADLDGTLSAAEIAAASASLRALDLDSDGVLSREELRPLPPADAPLREHRPPSAPGG